MGTDPEGSYNTKDNWIFIMRQKKALIVPKPDFGGQVCTDFDIGNKKISDRPEYI